MGSLRSQSPSRNPSLRLFLEAAAYKTLWKLLRDQRVPFLRDLIRLDSGQAVEMVATSPEWEITISVVKRKGNGAQVSA